MWRQSECADKSQRQCRLREVNFSSFQKQTDMHYMLSHTHHGPTQSEPGRCVRVCLAGQLVMPAAPWGFTSFAQHLRLTLTPKRNDFPRQ